MSYDADTQGFDTRASRVACLVLGVFFLLTLVWARKSAIAWFTIIFAAGLIVLCWLVASSVALRFLVLFIGVMSCLYSVVSFSSSPRVTMAAAGDPTRSSDLEVALALPPFSRCSLTPVQWDVIDDTLRRKVNGSDATEFAKVVRFGTSRMWGFFWLIISCGFFAAGIICGILFFKDDFATQREKAATFLGGTPGNHH